MKLVVNVTCSPHPAWSTWKTWLVYIPCPFSVASTFIPIMC